MVEEIYTSIYADMIKYFTNRQEGIKGYITVNSVNGESKLVKLDEGMRYMPSAMFLENLDRKLRFTYPCNLVNMRFILVNQQHYKTWCVFKTFHYTYHEIGWSILELYS